MDVNRFEKRTVAVTESDLATAVVDEHSRMSPVALTLAWWSIVSAMFYIFVAGALAIGFGTADALIGIAGAVVTYGVIGAVLARYAVRTGLGCFLLSRLIFGRIGASVATLIFFATAIYYAVFEGSVLANAAVKIIPGLRYDMACALIVLYSVPLVLGSVQHWLNRFNGFLLPFYLLGLTAAVALALHTYGYSDRWLALGPSGRHADVHWWDCFVAYLGASVLFMFAQDYARFGRRADLKYHASLNFGFLFYTVAFAVNGAIGIFLIGTTQLKNLTESSVVDAFIAVLGPIAALMFVWVSQTRINTANYYVATVNMQAFFESLTPIRISKGAWAVLVGGTVLALMLSSDVLHYILAALAYQGAFITAWVGVAMAHVLLNAVHRTQSDINPVVSDGMPAFKTTGIAAWLCGAAASLLLMQGSGALKTLSTPAALLIAGAAYLALSYRSK